MIPAAVGVAMFRTVLHRLRTAAARVVPWAGDDSDGEDSDASRFVPSELDASVRYAHGGSGDEIDRELADIEAEAQRIDENTRRK
jgi:hypothetical protein